MRPGGDSSDVRVFCFDSRVYEEEVELFGKKGTCCNSVRKVHLITPLPAELDRVSGVKRVEIELELAHPMLSLTFVFDERHDLDDPPFTLAPDEVQIGRELDIRVFLLTDIFDIPRRRRRQKIEPLQTTEPRLLGLSNLRLTCGIESAKTLSSPFFLTVDATFIW